MVTLQYRLLIKILFIIFIFSLSACSPLTIKGKDGSIKYIILGFGVVTVPKNMNDIAITATKMNTLGMSISNQPGLKFSLGYSSGFFVTVPDHASDVRLEVNQKLDGTIILDTINAELNSSAKGVKNEHQNK